ncbi:MAG: hypothetical protein ACOC9R_02370 [bacterium]
MDRTDGEPGPAAGADRRRPQPALPPLDLGDRTGDAEGGAGREPPRPADGKPVPMWQRLVAVAAALLSGVVVGTYGWQSAHQGTDEPRLATGPIEVAVTREQSRPVGPGPQQLRIVLFNDGAQDARVAEARLTGWSWLPGIVFSPQRIPAGGSASILVVAEPDCEGEPPGQLRVDVRTDTGVSSVPLSLPPEPHRREVERLYRQACEGAAPMLSVHSVDVSRQPDATGVLPMSVRLSSSAPDTRVTAVGTGAPGFSVAGRALPAPIVPPPHAMVDLEWSVVDCAATADLAEVTVDAEVSTPETTATVPVSLGRAAVVELAGFAGEVCAS